MPRCHATRQANRSRTAATAKVARTDGTNKDVPETLGTALDPPEVGERAIQMCQTDKATNARLTAHAKTVTVLMGFNLRHERQAGSLLRSVLRDAP